MEGSPIRPLGLAWRWAAGGVLAAGLGALGCGTSEATPDAGSVFVATAANFCGFHSWSNAAATSASDAGIGIHDAGPLRVYWNPPPPHGQDAFPVGTIIVKETEQADPTTRTTFAMAKRGGGFNATGAKGWEWFSLLDAASDGSDCPLILWRVAPPASESYAGTPGADCDGCHLLASQNDSVWDSALQLSQF